MSTGPKPAPAPEVPKPPLEAVRASLSALREAGRQRQAAPGRTGPRALAPRRTAAGTVATQSVQSTASPMTAASEPIRAILKNRDTDLRNLASAIGVSPGTLLDFTDGLVDLDSDKLAVIVRLLFHNGVELKDGRLYIKKTLMFGDS
jgi:hypothetical protein